MAVRTGSGQRAVKHTVYLVIIILAFVSVIYMPPPPPPFFFVFLVFKHSNSEEGKWLVRRGAPAGLSFLGVVWNR